jgi:hypothetical protein
MPRAQVLEGRAWMVGLPPTLTSSKTMSVRSLAAMLAGLLICGEVGAHSFYSKQCCDDQDCFPVDRISKRWDGGYDVIVKDKIHQGSQNFREHLSVR